MEPLRRRFKNLYMRMKSVRIIPQAFRKYRQIREMTKGSPEWVVVTLTEHIGDIVACEPISRFLTQERNQKVIWIINHRYAELLKYNPDIRAAIEVSSLAEWIYLKKLLSRFTSLPIHDLHLDRRICANYKLQLKNKIRPDITPENYYHYGALLTAFCHVGGLPPLKAAPRFYLPPQEKQSNLELPEKYIAIQTTSNEERRSWDLRKWEELINYFHEFTFVELGTKQTIHCDNCISSYCGKISLLEAAQIIENSQMFIGSDSAFAHFANAFAKPSVILLGKFAAFDYYMPYSGNFENVEIATVLHHSDTVRNLPTDEVIRAVKARMEQAGLLEKTAE